MAGRRVITHNKTSWARSYETATTLLLDAMNEPSHNAFCAAYVAAVEAESNAYTPFVGAPAPHGGIETWLAAQLKQAILKAAGSFDYFNLTGRIERPRCPQCAAWLYPGENVWPMHHRDCPHYLPYPQTAAANGKG